MTSYSDKEQRQNFQKFLDDLQFQEEYALDIIEKEIEKDILNETNPDNNFGERQQEMDNYHRDIYSIYTKKQRYNILKPFFKALKEQRGISVHIV